MGNECSCLRCDNKGNITDLSSKAYISLIHESLFSEESQNTLMDFSSINKNLKKKGSSPYDYEKIKFLKQLTTGENYKITSSKITLINSYIKGYLFRKKYKYQIKSELMNFERHLFKEYIKIVNKNKKVHEIFDNTENIKNPNNKINEILSISWTDFYTTNPNLKIENKIIPTKKYKNRLLFKYRTKNFYSEKIIECLGSAEYCYKGEVDFITNKKTGYGEIFYINGSRKRGSFYNDEFVGWNTLITEDAVLYIGFFIKEKLNGKGIRYDKSMGHFFQGDFYNGLREGKGEETFCSSKYIGEYKKDKKNGNGKIIFDSGDLYEGGFKDGKMNGYGCYFWKKNGHEYKGNYLDGKFHGMGYYKWGENEYYLGKYQNGIKEGRGEISYKNGSKLNVNFTKGKPNGIGIIQDKDGNKTEVEFIDGKMNKDYNSK